MKFVSFTVTAALVWSASAFRLVHRENPRVVGLDIQRRHVDNPIVHDRLRRRQDIVQATLDNLETLYFANASLGTPQQQFRFHIDTGSSDLWANAKSSNLCKQKGDLCAESGTYDANSSSTYEYVNSDFNISYVDGSGAWGDYAKDTIHFGGRTIEGLQFGIGYNSTSPEGILGIGYPMNEVQVQRAGGQPYPNLPQLLANEGVINTNAYSLWLNDLDASTGSILFGGVDNEKFEGELQKLPIIPNNGVFKEFVIAMTAMGMNGVEGSVFSDEVVPVLLDSGSSLMYLPDSIVSGLYQQFNAQWDPNQGAAFVDCNQAETNADLLFTFSGVTITVPMNELVIVAGTQGDQPICILGIGPAGTSTCVLGDTFLRSAYVVYDLDNNQIALAQTNFNATASHIQEIESGDDGIPDAERVENPVSTAVAGTGGARIGNPTVTGTARTTPTAGAALTVQRPDAWLGAGAALAGGVVLLGL